jgi:opacity protein-like surface antigen
MKLPRHLALLAAALCIIGLSGPAAAQGRLGDVEYYGMAGYTSGDAGQLKSLPNVHFDLDRVWMYGGGIGYFLTDQLSVVSELAWGSSDFKLSDSRMPGGPSYTQTADYFDGKLNVEFTPFPQPLSPFVTAGIGFENFQTVVPGASPQLYCAPGVVYWWCGAAIPTYNETAFSYNVGIGGRIDVTRTLFVKLMYTSTWADFGGLGTRRFDQVTLQIGGRIKTRE